PPARRAPPAVTRPARAPRGAAVVRPPPPRLHELRRRHRGDSRLPRRRVRPVPRVALSVERPPPLSHPPPARRAGLLVGQPPVHRRLRGAVGGDRRPHRGDAPRLAERRRHGGPPARGRRGGARRELLAAARRVSIPARVWCRRVRAPPVLLGARSVASLDPPDTAPA